ncbi:Periplasmic copper-binding protein (NosD) [Candidatus Burarchaeum australiense]|nr:Periplasmic copper-binding protein (NosD) [Candidatus Burarchaeum australiense]
MVSKGQARLPLVLALIVLAGLALSQQEGAPPSLSWFSSETGASWDGSAFHADNSLIATSVPAGNVSIAIAGCPAEWVCLADPASIDHDGTDKAYPVTLLIIAPQNSSGTLAVSASDSTGVSSGAWVIAVSPPSGAQPPGQPHANETQEQPAEQPPVQPANETLPPAANETQEQPPGQSGSPGKPTPQIPEGFTKVYACGELARHSVLVNDISTDGNCFTIVDDNSVLDCAGHSITQTKQGESYGIAVNGAGHTSIRNCVIINFSGGIILRSSAKSSITDTIVKSEAGYGIVADSSPDLKLSNVVADIPWSEAIMISAESFDAQLLNVTASSYDGAALYVDSPGISIIGSSFSTSAFEGAINFQILGEYGPSYANKMISSHASSLIAGGQGSIILVVNSTLPHYIERGGVVRFAPPGDG